MFLWVPSHIGILVPLELRDIYAIIDIHILKLWQDMWDNNHSNIYYSYEPKVAYQIKIVWSK